MTTTQPSKPKSRLGLWIAVVLLTMALVTSAAINGGLLLGIAAHLFTGYDEDLPVDENPTFTEIWSYGSGTTKVVRIALDGVIMRETEEGLFTPAYDWVEMIKQQILAARTDEEVQAIILEVNSPGGGVTESDEIYDALMKFKQSREGRKILVFVKDLAASGGYYAAAAGDWIIAEPTSIVGSIGVIMQSLNLKGLTDKIGIADVTIKSGANKDILNPFRETNPAELAMLQGLIDQMYGRFFGIVQSSRKLDPDVLKPLADGSIFTSDDALRHKLIDQIGYFEDALAKTAELFGDEELHVVRYEVEDDFWSMLGSMRAPSIKVPSLHQARTPRLLYLWQP